MQFVAVRMGWPSSATHHLNVALMGSRYAANPSYSYLRHSSPCHNAALRSRAGVRRGGRSGGVMTTASHGLWRPGRASANGRHSYCRLVRAIIESSVSPRPIEPTMSITFTLPPTIEEGLRAQFGDVAAIAKEATLVELYRQAKLSHGQFAEALGLSRRGQRDAASPSGY